MLVRAVLGSMLVLCSLLASQDTTALSGQVEDSGPVAGAIVTISNRGFIKSVTTDAEGRFLIESVPPGQYDFRTSAHGYAVFERPVILHESTHRRIDVKHLIPADQQCVSVIDLATRRLARN